jgi:peroxiredoxin
MVSIGEKAPSFNLINHKREAVSLEQFLGKKVVLAFFPAAFTGVCEKELCSFRDSLAALNEARRARCSASRSTRPSATRRSPSATS